MYRKFILLIIIVIFLTSLSFAQTINTDQQGDQLLAEVRTILAPMGIIVNRNFPVFVRPYDDIQRQNIAKGGLSMEVAGFYKPYGGEAIWMMAGLPKYRAISTLAHEYTHAWQTDNCPLQDRMLSEGFATWVEYKVLTKMGYTTAANQLFSGSNADYSQGLKIFYNIEQKQGTQAAIDYAKTAKKP